MKRKKENIKKYLPHRKGKIVIPPKNKIVYARLKEIDWQYLMNVCHNDQKTISRAIGDIISEARKKAEHEATQVHQGI